MLKSRKYLLDVNTTPVNLRSLSKIKPVISSDLNPNTAFQHSTFVYLLSYNVLRSFHSNIIRNDPNML